MTSVPRALLLALVLVLISAAAVAAQTPPGGPNAPTPVAPPPPVGTVAPPQPALGIWVVVDENDFDSYALPYDFHFVDEVNGYGFKPGERVTITPHGVSSAPVTVEADQYGALTSRFSFTWVFCGPQGAAGSAPWFEASGSAGTVAQVTQFHPNCPLLVSPMSREIPVPAPEPGSPPPQLGGTGVAPPAGTVIAPSAGTAIAQPVGTAVSLPPNGQGTPSAPPQITPAPKITTVQLEGFGFVSGERVTVTSQDPSSAPDINGAATADSMGRFTYALTVRDVACGLPSQVKVEASGDKGTSVIGYVQPMGICAPCKGPEDAECPPPPGVPDPIPAPGPPTIAPQTGSVPAGQLAVRLGHASVKRGSVEQSSVVSDSAGTLNMTVRYAGNKTYRMTRQATAGKSTTVKWRVARTVRTGPATLTVVRASDGSTVRASFRVR